MPGNKPYFEIKRKAIFDILDKFPDTPSRTLAKILKRDNSELFKDIESARSSIRAYRGKNGKSQREGYRIIKYYQDV
jgi:hypothetical protein